MGESQIVWSPTEDWLTESLGQPESRVLEFKSQFYNLGAVSEKSEFVKDVLAMANSLARDEKGAIIFGVDDPKRSNQIIGIDQHPDPCRLVQILENHASPVPQIKYHPIEWKRRLLGVLEVPYSPFRPHWSTRDVTGSLDKHVIYLRRDSVVGIATPHETEILLMQKQTLTGDAFVKEPIQIGFVERTTGSQPLRVVARVTNLVAEPISGIDVILEGIADSFGGACFCEQRFSGASLEAGASVEATFEVTPVKFFQLGKPVTSQNLGPGPLHLTLVVRYRDRNGFFRQITDKLTLPG